MPLCAHLATHPGTHFPKSVNTMTPSATGACSCGGEEGKDPPRGEPHPPETRDQQSEWPPTTTKSKLLDRIYLDVVSLPLRCIWNPSPANIAAVEEVHEEPCSGKRTQGDAIFWTRSSGPPCCYNCNTQSHQLAAVSRLPHKVTCSRPTTAHLAQEERCKRRLENAVRKETRKTARDMTSQVMVCAVAVTAVEPSRPQAHSQESSKASNILGEKNELASFARTAHDGGLGHKDELKNQG